LVSNPHLGSKTKTVLMSVSGLLCGVASLAKGQICRLQFLLAPARAVILGSDSCMTHDSRLLQSEEPDPRSSVAVHY
jgi:hypothetical protein